MAAKGYCTADEVADFLGVTFTAAQQTYCESLIERAEVDVDEETGRGWLVGAQTDEPFYYPPFHIYLKYTPVTSIQAITGRTGIGEAETVLTAEVDYEVRSLAEGHLFLVTPGVYERVQVDYTPVASVPGDLKEAFIELVALRMQPQLNVGMYGLDSYSLPDLTVKFARSHVQVALPPFVMRVLDRYRWPVHA